MSNTIKKKIKTKKGPEHTLWAFKNLEKYKVMNLKEYRTAKGYTQSQIAEILGVSGSQYQMWESGSRKPNVETLMLFANKLGVQVVIKPDSREFEIKESEMVDFGETDHPDEVIDAALEFYKKIQELKNQK